MDEKIRDAIRDHNEDKEHLTEDEVKDNIVDFGTDLKEQIGRPDDIQNLLSPMRVETDQLKGKVEFIINGLTEKAALFDRAAAIKEEMSACASVLSALCSVRGLESAKSVIDEVTARHEKLSNELHAVLRS